MALFHTDTRRNRISDKNNFVLWILFLLHFILCVRICVFKWVFIVQKNKIHDEDRSRRIGKIWLRVNRDKHNIPITILYHHMLKRHEKTLTRKVEYAFKQNKWKILEIRSKLNGHTHSQPHQMNCYVNENIEKSKSKSKCNEMKTVRKIRDKAKEWFTRWKR